MSGIEYDASVMFQKVAPLALMGWKIVKLWGVRPDGTCTCGNPECRTPGKHPAGGGDWQHRATSDEDTIGRWFDDASQSINTRINVGVRLGDSSGVIDVEYDTEQAHAALKAFGLDLIDTPAYQSGRGVHRIFAYESWMPDAGVVKVSGIEVRIGGGGKASQSVIPPSLHARGTQYEWLPGKSPEEVAPARLPDAFREAVLSSARRKGSGAVVTAMNAVASGARFGEGDRHQNLIGIASHHASRIPVFSERELQILIGTMLDANCRCDPPKSEAEVVKIARDQFAYYHNLQVARKARSTFARAGLAWNAEDRCWEPGQWRLTVVHADPVEYKLRMPSPDEADKSVTVVLTGDNWHSAKGVATAILKETRTLDVHSPTASRWSALWNGEAYEDDQGRTLFREGLRERLLADADHEHLGPEFSTVSANAATLLMHLDQIEKKEPETDDDRLPRKSGQPKWLKMKNGEWRMYFHWDPMVTEAWSRTSAKAIPLMTSGPGRRLYGKIEEVAGVKIGYNVCNRKGSNGKKPEGKWRVFTESHIEALRSIACGASGSEEAGEE